MDARWRDHLAEMDNLKDGIHLRWTVQADPLNAWQQEGYSMFGQLMEVIDNDYLRYILHVEAVQPSAAEPDLDRAVYAAAEDPVGETGALATALLGRAGDERGGADVAPGAVGRWWRGRERSDRGAAPAVWLVSMPAWRWRQRWRWRWQGQDQATERPRPGRVGAHREGPAREDRPQRAVLVRERQEVQALPWRRLTGPRPRHPATSHPNSKRWGSGWPKRSATSVGTSSRPGGPSSRPTWPSRTCGTTPTTRASVTKELGRVTADLEQLDGLRSALEDASALLELTEESAAEGASDAALDAELVETVASLGTRLGALELQSLFSGEYDEFDAVCEVHAGAGGTDAQDWAEMLLRMYQRWAERRGFTVEVDEATEGQEAGLLSATFIVHGRFAYGLLATERGVHRLVRMSPFDSQHRRQTSFASMDVTPFLEDVSSEVEIDEKDLRVDTYRSSGAGGQHVNKTDSAVRLTHLPTGIVVVGPERAEPAPEQGQGACRSSVPSWRSGPGPSAGPSWTP